MSRLGRAGQARRSPGRAGAGPADTVAPGTVRVIDLSQAGRWPRARRRCRGPADAGPAPPGRYSVTASEALILSIATKVRKRRTLPLSKNRVRVSASYSCMSRVAMMRMKSMSPVT